MDKESFEQTIVEMVRESRQTPEHVTQLPEKNMQQLEANVYTHINNLFANDHQTPVSDEPSNIRRPGIFTTFKKHLGEIFEKWTIQKTAIAFASISIMSVGAITYQLTNTPVTNNPDYERFLSIPDSVAAAGIDEYINLPTDSSRSMVTTEPSERRLVFLTGVTRAGIDVIGNPSSRETKELATAYQVFISGNPSTNSDNDLDGLNKNVLQFAENSKTNEWLTHGYAVEIVHLAAKRSLVDMETNILTDALNYYQKVTGDFTEIDQGSDVTPQFKQNHLFLFDAVLEKPVTPNQIQSFIDKTQQMKIVIR